MMALIPQIKVKIMMGMDVKIMMLKMMMMIKMELLMEMMTVLEEN